MKLAVAETHFALRSPINAVELPHLQTGIKLRLCEVDALFAATYRDSNGFEQRMVITVEAKKKNQRILEEQVIWQVKATFTATPIDPVMPIAMLSVNNGIYFAEFKAARRNELENFMALELQEEALYTPHPHVKGI